MKAANSTRVKWVIALAVATSAFWLMGVLYVLSYKPEVYVSPGTVTSHVPAIYSPSSTPITIYRPARALGGHHSSHYSNSWTSSHMHMPSIGMQSTGGIFLTSKAQMHSIGGGGGGGGIYATSQGGSSSRSVQYGSSGAGIPQVNFIAMASTRQMASPEAQSAPELAKLASAPNNAPGPPNPPGPLPDDHQLVEHLPVGDAIIPLLLLAFGYGAYRFIRRRKNQLTD